MNTDDMLVEQAARNKARNPTAKVFVYRNIVKVRVVGILTRTLRVVTDVLGIVKQNDGPVVSHRHCRGTLRSESCCKTRRTGVRPVAELAELNACARVSTTALGHCCTKARPLY